MRARHRLEILRRVERPLPPPVAPMPVVADPSWEEVMLSLLAVGREVPPVTTRPASPPSRPAWVSWEPWDPDLDPTAEDTLDPMSGAA